MIAWIGPGLLLQQPGDGFGRAFDGQGLRVDPSTGRHHPGAVGEGCRQIRIEPCSFQHGSGVDGHAPRLLTEVIAAGSHQPQVVKIEIGAEPGHTAHIEGAGGLHQHQGQGLFPPGFVCAGGRAAAHSRLRRWASRSAMAWGSGWKRGIGGVRPLTTWRIS